MRTPQTPTRTQVRSGFTLTELIAVMVVLSLVAMLAPPLLGRNHSSSSAAVCLGNLRVLTTAWQLYASENRDRLVLNYDGGDAILGTVANRPDAAPWASGWLTWGTETDNTNRLFIRNEKYARLAPYILQPENVHKCPSDTYLSAVQRGKGWAERTRSYSMNFTIGMGGRLTGPWDTNYTRVKLLSALINPLPSESSLFLEEHPDSMNDPGLFPPIQNGWVDTPGNFHDNACSVSFADGHAEIHTWKASLRDNPIRYGATGLRVNPGDLDRTWVSYRSQRVSSLTY